jgi:hypothetical protein
LVPVLVLPAFPVVSLNTEDKEEIGTYIYFKERKLNYEMGTKEDDE